MAGALRHLNRAADDEILTGRDKENHRLRIQLDLDVEFESLTKAIQHRFGVHNIWDVPIRQGDLPYGDHLHIMTTATEQFILIRRALFPLNERLRDYVWEEVC